MSATATATFDIPSPAVGRVRCADCAARACEALSGVPGVLSTDCDRAGGTVRVEFDAARISESDLAAQLKAFGIELAERTGHAAWRITGLD